MQIVIKKHRPFPWALVQARIVVSNPGALPSFPLKLPPPAGVTLSTNPPRVKAIRYPVRDKDTCDRFTAEILCIDDNALTLIDVFVLNEANNITVIFL